MTKNREVINKKCNERRRSCLNFKISYYLRNRLNKAISNNQKNGSAIRDLGGSIELLKRHLESKFHANPKTGELMTWDNWTTDGWHIDHIKPLAQFNLSDREQLLRACHYTNLQPLWAKDNLSKGARTQTEQMPNKLSE